MRRQPILVMWAVMVILVAASETTHFFLNVLSSDATLPSLTALRLVVKSHYVDFAEKLAPVGARYLSAAVG